MQEVIHPSTLIHLLLVGLYVWGLFLIAKNVDAAVPTPGAFSEADTTILKEADGLLAKTREAYDDQAFNRALEGIWEVISSANRYIDDQAPWALRKTDPKRMATVLYTLLDVIRYLAILMQPVVPGSANTMLDQLGVGPDARDFIHLTAEHRVAPGTPLPKPAPIFPRHVAAE